MREKILMQKKIKNKNLDVLFDDFIRNCKVRNLRPATIQYYEDFINIFFKFIDYKTPANKVTKDTIDSYVLFLKKKGTENDTTINSNLNAIRSFCKFCQENGYMEKFKIDKIRADRHIISTYTDSELALLLKKPNTKECNFKSFRNWCICNTLFATGMRASSLINLKVKDLDFDNSLIKYSHTKNRKQQVVPMSHTLSKVLAEYLQFRKTETEEDYVFVNAYGGFLQRNQLSHDLKEYNKQRHVNQFGVHKWRHTFAKKWIMNNGDTFRLQKILQHSTLDMTRIYVDMFTTDLQKDFNTFNPLEQMQRNKGHISMKGGK